VNTLSRLPGTDRDRSSDRPYGASFILARTENDSSETPFEEDNWAAAIEWAESLGVQVTRHLSGISRSTAPTQPSHGRT